MFTKIQIKECGNSVRGLKLHLVTTLCYNLSCQIFREKKEEENFD